jgi:hypothetical protein
MPVDQPHLSSVLLTQRLLWHRTLGGPSRSQPVVVLLGPVGSGKSTALESISAACGAEVVHALVDFQPAESAAAESTTVETLVRLAFELSRSWKPRPRAHFTRFTLGLIAVQTSLDERNRDEARETLRVLIRKFTRNLRAERVAELLNDALDMAKSADVLTAPTAEIVRTLLPPLIRTVARWPVRKAERWHADIPEAEGATPLDALVALNRAKPTEITEWLTAAFLTDVRDSHPRMAAPDRFSRCSCRNPSKARHSHNWVLLLDNVDHPGGTTFIVDLLAARERHLRQHPSEHDPLVIVATSGRWDSHWEAGWWAPWHATAENTDRVRTVLRCHEANYEH